jgi:hypothetical protein
LVAFFIVFYYLFLPLIKEKLFQSKLKKADQNLLYSLIFNRLRDIFCLSSSATLEDTVNIANIYLPIDKKIITSVIYNGDSPNPQIVSDYIAIRRGYKRK